jgi:hypothetical protein
MEWIHKALPRSEFERRGAAEIDFCDRMRDRKQKLNLTSTFVHLPNLTT